MTAGTAGMVYDSRPRQGRSQASDSIVRPFKPRPEVPYDPDTDVYPPYRRLPLNLLSRLWNSLNPDRRSEWEKKTEREFIEAIGRIRTLSVTDRGGASFDQEEIREKVIASREQLKRFVHRPPASASCISTRANSEGC